MKKLRHCHSMYICRVYMYTAVYMAVNGPCARVHGRVRAMYTAVTRPWTRMCTRPIYGCVHGRLHGAYTAVDTARVDSLITAMKGPCTPAHGLCTRQCTRAVSTAVYTIVYTACTRTCTWSCTRPCTRSVCTARTRPCTGRTGRVQADTAVYTKQQLNN